MSERLLRLPQVQAMFPMSRAYIYSEISAGRFPKPVAVGVRAVAWKQSEIEALIEAKASASQQPRARSA